MKDEDAPAANIEEIVKKSAEKKKERMIYGGAFLKNERRRRRRHIFIGMQLRSCLEALEDTLEEKAELQQKLMIPTKAEELVVMTSEERVAWKQREMRNQREALRRLKGNDSGKGTDGAGVRRGQGTDFSFGGKAGNAKSRRGVPAPHSPKHPPPRYIMEQRIQQLLHMQDRLEKAGGSSELLQRNILQVKIRLAELYGQGSSSSSSPAAIRPYSTVEEWKREEENEAMKVEDEVSRAHNDDVSL